MNRFYALLFCFASGVAVGTIFGTYTFFLLLVCIAASVGLYAKLMIPADIRGNFIFAVVLLCAVGAGIGRVAIETEPSRDLDPYAGGKAKLEGVVIREPDRRESYSQVVLDIDRAERDGKIVSVNARVIARIPLEPECGYGDRIRVEGGIDKPENFEAGTDRTFDYISFLAKDKIGYVVSFASAERISSGHGNTAIRILVSVKRSFVGRIRRAFTEPHASLLVGILLGGKSGLGERAEGDFRAAGLSHIIVLSGFNIAIIAKAVEAIAKRATSRFAGLFSAFSIILFVVMVGAEPSVVRAAMMAILVVLAGSLGRTYDPMRALVVAGLIMLMHNPLILIHDPSFQLSLLATMGLVLVTPHVLDRLRVIPESGGLREIVATTISTQVFVLPFILYMTGNLSLVALPANVLVLPLIPAAMLLGFIAACAAFVSVPVSIVAGFPAYLALEGIFALSHAAASIPLATIVIPMFPAWFLVPAYGAYWLALVRLKQHDALRNGEKRAGISDEAMEYELVA